MASTSRLRSWCKCFAKRKLGAFLADRVPLSEADRRLGSGLTPSIYNRPESHDPRLVLLMITLSDNEATDLLLKRVGAKNVTATLRQLESGHAS